jgi:hypothetical protein
MNCSLAHTMKQRALTIWLPLTILGCTSSSEPADDGFGDGKADSTSSATYFDCEGLGTSNTTWLAISRTQKYVRLTIEGVGVNQGTRIKTTSTDRTYSDWTSNVFFQSGDTLMVPGTLMSSGAGMVQWNVSGVPRWEGACTRKQPSGDQCLPLVHQIYPVDSMATAVYATVGDGQYTVTVPDTSVGDFVYSIAMNVSGLLCTQGDVTPTSCSGVVADAAGNQAYSDGASSGAPYVSARTASGSGYSWTAGIHDAESGEFAYTVTTDSDRDGCHVVSIQAIPTPP